MEQRGVRENAIKRMVRECQRQKMLVENRAAGMGARHGTKGVTAVQADRTVAEGFKMAEVSAGAAAKIQNIERLLQPGIGSTTPGNSG